jgi:quercetin dioxygenase-like cupin family protein
MFLASILAACGGAHAEAPSADPVAIPDAATTDPDKYHVVLDNEHVRVLDYTDRPGQKTSLHHHPDFVLHALGPFERRLHFADGTSRVVSFHGGETVFMPAQTHAGENIGTTDTHVLIVELKHR